MRSVSDTLPQWPSIAEAWPRRNVGQPKNAGIQNYCDSKAWQWSGRHIIFVCDIHADAAAFLFSLEASGAIVRRGDLDFDLTELGKTTCFIIGGDCFDKGPSNLDLIEAVHQLHLKGAEIELLAGNHDVRTFLGIYHAQSKDPLLDHLFVRMGTKTIALFKEIFNEYVITDGSAKLDSQDIALIRQQLMPSDSWYQQFPEAASGLLSPIQIDKELKRIAEKTAEFELRLAAVDLDLVQLQLCLNKFYALFFASSGRYRWFFDKMKLAHREQSYLFVHAGVDDAFCQRLEQDDLESINHEFKAALLDDSFALYYGVLGNVFRTKYRVVDFSLSDIGAGCLDKIGVYAIVHGHRNLLRGQNLVLRQGILNFECDASIDVNTRRREGLVGRGAAAVVFTADGNVNAYSADYGFIKRFSPASIEINGLHSTENTQ